MTTIAMRGNRVTLGDASSGFAAGALTAATSTAVGMGSGMLIGNRISPGGPGKGLGIIIGGLAGGITGLGAALLAGGTVTALREPGRDLTGSSALMGAAGGVAAGIVHGIRGGNAPAGVLTLAAIGALCGGTGGAVAGTVFEQ